MPLDQSSGSDCSDRNEKVPAATASATAVAVAVAAQKMKKRALPTKEHAHHRDHRNASLDKVYDEIESEIHGMRPPPSRWRQDCARMAMVTVMCCVVVMVALSSTGAPKPLERSLPKIRGVTFPPSATIGRSVSIVDPKTTINKEPIQFNSFQQDTNQAQHGTGWTASSNGAQQQQQLQLQPENQKLNYNVGDNQNQPTHGNIVQQNYIGEDPNRQQSGYIQNGQFVSNSMQQQQQRQFVGQSSNGQVGMQIQGLQMQQYNGIQQVQPSLNQYQQQLVQQKPNQYNQPQGMQQQLMGQQQNNRAMPLTVKETTVPQQQQQQASNATQVRRILTLGGSTTWGSKLDKKEDAYPHVLSTLMGPAWSVVNLAVRATDASYASQCIESMVREGVPPEDTDQDFDVIMLEYSLNGIDGMPLLLERLRRRYPTAVVIYVHLWSLRMTVDNAKTGEKPRDVLKAGHTFLEADEIINEMLGDKTAVWSWGEAMVADSKNIAMDAMDATLKIKGYLYELPMPEQPSTAFSEQWFGPDYHHLSVSGHHLVATGLADLLKTVTPPAGAESKYAMRTWGKGDQCYSWYEHGKHEAATITGGTMKMFVKPDKWALHVGQRFGQPATVDFANTHPESQPVELVIMSWGPGVYPKSKISLKSVDKPESDQSFLLDPLHPSNKQQVFHVTRTIHVGWAEPGQNKLSIDPIETTQRPIRITGIVMCGACIEMDSTYLSLDAGQGHGELEGATNFLPKEVPGAAGYQPQQP